MYKETLDESNKQKSALEVKLVEANENYSAIKAENEALKEKIDILFKLGREYLNGKKVHGDMAEDEITEIHPDESDDLQEWTSQKLRGFLRKKGPIENSSKNREISPKKGLNEAKKPTVVSNREREREKASDVSHDNQRVRFCHYYVNEGKCNFEKRTGERCKFEHKTAPACNFGSNCRRYKCMFSHPKVPNQPFLGRNPHHLGQMNMINPWFHPPVQNQRYYPNPWETNFHLHQRNQNQN